MGVIEQLGLDLNAGLCHYGDPRGVLCTAPATHAAVVHWYRGDDEGIARRECCRSHADYYASAWAYGPCLLSLTDRDVAWIEVLP